MKNKVAFVLYGYPLGVSSMVVNSIKLFAGKGIGVDVFMDRETYDSSPANFGQAGIRTVLYENKRLNSFSARVLLFAYSAINRILFLFLFYNLLKRFSRQIPFRLLRMFYLRDHLFSKWLSDRMKDGYDYIFPVEAKSLIAAASLGSTIYFNMELLDWSEQNPIYGRDKKFIKLLEHEAISEIYAVAIQNDERARKFREVNNFEGRIFILPVASIGDAISHRGFEIRRRFNIGEETTVAIYSGNIMPWARCEEIIESVRDWPKNFCLVIHTWRKGAFDSGYGLRLKKKAHGLPVFFSDDYMDIEDLPEFLSSADLALMFYQPIDTNFTEILFSSNKLAEYLKAGLPVITSDLPGLKQFIAGHNIGKTVGDFNELPGAVASIAADFDRYKVNVAACYQKTFRFENFFEPFFNQLYPQKNSARRIPNQPSSSEKELT